MKKSTLADTEKTPADGRFMKRLYCPKDFYRFLGDMFASMGDMRRGRKEKLVSHEFSERVMLAVTEVNGCRYCSYFHTQVALKSGMDEGEVRQALSGDFSNAPQEELPAMMFAQHYAEYAGKPQPEMLAKLVETYGEEKAAAILGYIRAIMMGNAWGNAFDSLRVRLKGHPNPDMTFGKELAVIFGPFYMLPVVLIQNLFTK
jgi:AhpD family alkylhydroperoxidase